MSSPLTCAQGHQWSAGGGRGLACPSCGAAPTLESLGAPPAVAAALRRLRDELTAAAGANLAGLIVFGGLARGRYRPDRSDINLVVLLRDVSAASLRAVAPALHRAWRAAAVEPLLLTPDEVRAAAELFPTKFLDIRDHHVVLAGDDPFAGLEVPRECLRLRAEQALCNLALRLRRRYLPLADDPASQARVLAETARPLALELAALLRLAGRPVPEVDRTADLLAAAAAAFALDGEALAQLAALRHNSRGREPVGPDLFGRVLQSVERAAGTARQMKGAPA